MGAHYRGKLSFNWGALDGAATALQRMRLAAYEWGPPGDPEVNYVNRFKDHVNDDLNMPRALALAWELIKSDLPAANKKATLLQFDRILGFELADWRPENDVVPGEIMAFVEQREKARAEKRWGDADALREQVRQAGYEIKDTPRGPSVRSRKRRPSTWNS
jgi:cysteinyl-tRNA synthetase